MGLESKQISDPNAAQPHEAGATVTVIQILEHAQWGTLAYAQPRYWSYHHVIAQVAFDEFAARHTELLRLEVRSGTRTVMDHEMLGPLYRTGCEFVLNAMLAVQHLCNEIEDQVGMTPSTAPVLDRLTAVAAAADLPLNKDDAGYAGLLEIRRIREAIEHPKPETVHRGRSGEWDRVPLAWLLSDRSAAAFARWDAWFTAFTSAWTDWLARRGPMTQTFEGVTRGVVSTRQSKKAPSA
jgi:hypothetical protein